jgi:hypothetical protein
MTFIIQYDREAGKIDVLRSFDDRGAAEAFRLKLEIGALSAGVDREIVTLEAESEEALRRTHRRYFDDVAQLMKPPAA